MGVLDRLASALGRNDEVPNQELAADLAKRRDAKSIAELAAALTGKSKAIQSDAVKALYEVGAIDPSLLAPHADAFLAALKAKNNRLVWGALTALDAIAATKPEIIAAHLPEILDAADRGSVIAKDKTVSMLATLATLPKHKKVAWERLIAILRTSEVNQTPMYAEAALKAAPFNDGNELAEVVRMRLEKIAQPAKRARLEKVLRKLAKA